MARKKVISLNADITIEYKDKPGTKWEGFYIGFKTVETNYGPTKLHHFVTDKGTVAAWGAGQLDGDLALIPRGTYAFVEFVKKIPGTKGRNPRLVFNVDFDDELTMDVGGISQSAPREEEPSYDEPEAIDETLAEEADLEAEAEEAEEESRPKFIPPAKVATPIARKELTEQQKKVADIMARRKQQASA